MAKKATSKSSLRINQNNPSDAIIEKLFVQATEVIDLARETAYRQINESLVRRNWCIGRMISQEELQGQNRAEYGAKIIIGLSKRLTNAYGVGFSKSYLYSYVQFYKLFPEIFQTLSGNSHQLLSWSHYNVLIQELNDDARRWYEEEAIKQNWSVRTLQRNVGTQYYYRLLSSQQKDLVESEMLHNTTQQEILDPTEFIKNPIVGEFLGFTVDTSFRESELEQSIIDNLEKFLLEMGKGFAFMARQQYIHTNKKDYFIDLVFYNVYLKCYVLIDLKTRPIEHQDVGQMDMYVRMYDELKRSADDNPTIGIVLCSETDEDIARFSILHDNDRLYASKYMLYMPTPEDLRREIERQKTIFYLKQKNQEI